METGKQALTNVNIRVRQKGSTSIRQVEVEAIHFPFVEGREQSPEEGVSATYVKIDLREVDQLEVYDPRTGLVILAVIGTIILLIGVIALIVALTKKSCPFVYVVTPDSDKSITTLRTLGEQPNGLSRFSLDLYRKYRELALASSSVEVPR